MFVWARCAHSSHDAVLVLFFEAEQGSKNTQVRRRMTIVSKSEQFYLLSLSSFLCRVPIFDSSEKRFFLVHVMSLHLASTSILEFCEHFENKKDNPAKFKRTPWLF